MATHYSMLLSNILEQTDELDASSRREVKLVMLEFQQLMDEIPNLSLEISVSMIPKGYKLSYHDKNKLVKGYADLKKDFGRYTLAVGTRTLVSGSTATQLFQNLLAPNYNCFLFGFIEKIMSIFGTSLVFNTPCESDEVGSVRICPPFKLSDNQMLHSSAVISSVIIAITSRSTLRVSLIKPNDLGSKENRFEVASLNDVTPCIARYHFANKAS